MGRSPQRAPGLTPPQSVPAEPDPQALYAAIRERLAASVDSDFAVGQRNFFQHEVDTWGVRSDAMKQITRAFWPAVKPWPAGPRNRLCTLLWESGKLEENALAVYFYERLTNHCGECEFKLFERWLDRYVNNWATCDLISSKLIAAILERHPAFVPAVADWRLASNRWKRRASAVSLVFEAKAARHLDAVLTVAAYLLPDPDDMVQKGVGWLLKEAYPSNSQAIASFWERHAPGAPALTLRIASEKMPAPVRERFRRMRNPS